MKELWIAEVMDLLQQHVPVMTDEHALDLADDLHRTCGGDPPRLAVARCFNAMPVDWGLGVLESYALNASSSAGSHVS